ncbi:MAG: ribosomal protein S18-alanine N-acetyltransferase [Cyanobacteriota bacterium]|nr:ribosomal protein S18-alanine N-acetyltransferase [Cyanobacteriota bacterium]
MTLHELRLQPLEAEQLEAVVALDRLCLGGLWTLQGYQRELESPNSELLCLTTQTGQGEAILGVGCFWAILEEAHITLLLVRPEFQGRGLGQALLLALLKNAVGRQLERATLEVRVSNEAALSLYRKFGFQVAGKRKGYYQESGEDALILWLGGLQREDFRKSLVGWQSGVEEKLRDRGWRAVRAY